MQRADDGDAAADAGFKQQIDLVLAGKCEQLSALCGNQFLVGGDHALVVL